MSYDEQLLITLHSNLDTVNVLCRRTFRMGNLGDGGWEVWTTLTSGPGSPASSTPSASTTTSPSTTTRPRMYGCHVYSFDPSMSKEKDQFDRCDISVIQCPLHKIGLDGKTYVNNRNWSMYTLQDIRRKLGHQNSRIDVIKMDIENSEWPALPEMLASGQLSDVNQFLVEYHVSSQDRDYILPKLKMVQQLEKPDSKILRPQESRVQNKSKRHTDYPDELL
ncbi:hypothetical protein Btru_076130 [Bulinus truncatus]|nr:hypothetical protein Btru_076130 [Bulinus truncatus]